MAMATWPLSRNQVDPPETNAQESAELNSNNQYQFQLEHATLVSAEVPHDEDLWDLTSLVASNNGYEQKESESDEKVMEFLHSKIKHVIYIVKENRTFDQILGDLHNGSNGDASLTLFGEGVTPSFHRMARNFVTIDNFMDPGDGSMDGWSWSMRGRVTNTETITQQENYARVNRGLSYEGEGQNRNIPANLNTTAGRDFFFDPTGATTPYSNATSSLSGGTPNILAGDGDHAATDGPTGYQDGYIFNAVLHAGGTVRNYGWMANTPGKITDTGNLTTGNPISDPYNQGKVVQTTAANQLIYQNNFYDPYFRAYDQSYPDVWRFTEWNREFQQFVANGNLPSLEMIRGLSHDHTGNFSTDLGGVNTPELQQADNDYAVGLLVQTVANSPYAKDSLIIIIEDDSQDGADHVDSHRATTYFVGPYVKQHAVVSTRYSQPNVLRTIEDIFGTEHLNLNTYYAQPMADLFDIKSSGKWTFSAVASTLLSPILTKPIAPIAQAGGLGLDPKTVVFAAGPQLKPTHDAEYWAARTRNFDFSGEDRVPKELYNKILWEGIKGTAAPAAKTRFSKVATTTTTTTTNKTRSDCNGPLPGHRGEGFLFARRMRALTIHKVLTEKSMSRNASELASLPRGEWSVNRGVVRAVLPFANNATLRAPVTRENRGIVIRVAFSRRRHGFLSIGTIRQAVLQPSFLFSFAGLPCAGRPRAG